MVQNYLEFEKPIAELEKELEKVKKNAAESGVKNEEEILRIRKKLKKQKKDIFKNLSSWQVVQMARHPDRPYALDYIGSIIMGFCEFHGDRCFADDPAIIAGIGFLKGVRVCVIGHQKGRNTKQKIFRNFGMPNPEGYRKAIRIMKLAEKFGIPILTLIDTPGAHPGVGAEERGQAEAIATGIKEMLSLRVPVISVITGEGGSGGALALAVGDRVLMLEHSIYSVISPEACATILLKDSSKAQDVAASLKMRAGDAVKLGIVDESIPEPLGGAHRSCLRTSVILRKKFLEHLMEIKKLSTEDMLEARFNKFRNIGQYKE